MRTREMQDQKYAWCITFINTGRFPIYMNTCIILLHHSPFLDICIHHQIADLVIYKFFYHY
ncbi:hypothetical protein T06_14449 [Trichinella sp. T6]|nr:hypothetical protein T06_14449 [Trichinella sp. T6]